VLGPEPGGLVLGGGGEPPGSGRRDGLGEPEEGLAERPILAAGVAAAVEGHGAPEQKAASLAGEAGGGKAAQAGLEGGGEGVGEDEGAGAGAELAAEVAPLGDATGEGSGEPAAGPAVGGKEVGHPALADQVQLVARGLEAEEGGYGEHDVPDPVAEQHDEGRSGTGRRRLHGRGGGGGAQPPTMRVQAARL